MVAWASTAVTNSCTWQPLLGSCVAQYQLAFIHPFADVNGRLGSLWQTLIHSREN
ncbi:MAG: Fic family protein, partial [Pirellulaceae bacterium]